MQFAIFQHEGNLPVLNEIKNKLRSGLASDEEHNFRRQAKIPSGSEDFLISRFACTLLTSLVRIWTSGIVHEERGVNGSGWSDSENDEILENISARILVLSTECVKVWPSFIKCGMNEVYAFFTVLTNDAIAILKNFRSPIG